MTGVALRLWLAALALFGLGLLAHDTISTWFWSPDEQAYWDQFLDGGHQLVRDRLDAEGDAALPALSGSLGVPIEPVPSTLIDRRMRERVAAGHGAWNAEEDGEYYYVPHAGRLLRVGPYTPAPNPNPPARLALLSLAAIGYALAFALALLPLRRSQRALTRTAEAIREGDLSARIAQRDEGATPEMARAFNAMAGRLEDLVAAQQHVLRAASHELRTPIARLRIGIHLLAGAEGDREARASELDRDLAELDDLVDEVLTHARLEQGSVPKEPAAVEVAPVVVEVLDQLRPLVGAVVLESDIGDLRVRAVPSLLKRCVKNLVGNASRYASARVRVSTEPTGTPVQLLVDDDGPGIPTADRDRVLLPFTRLGEKGGYGMGLAIVARVVRWHGGEVSIEDSPLGGCRVRLTWPRA